MLTMDLYDEFFSLIEAFDAASVPYAVCGGIAVAIHGYPRFTEDIDLLIHLSDEQRALQVAATRQFTIEGGRLRVKTRNGRLSAFPMSSEQRCSHSTSCWPPRRCNWLGTTVPSSAMLEGEFQWYRVRDSNCSNNSLAAAKTNSTSNNWD
jgi:hypothetical protein